MVDLTNIDKLAEHIESTHKPFGVTTVRERPNKLLVYENQPTGSLLYLQSLSNLIRIFNLQWWVTYDEIKKQCVLIVTT